MWLTISQQKGWWLDIKGSKARGEISIRDDKDIDFRHVQQSRDYTNFVMLHKGVLGSGSEVFCLLEVTQFLY